jgi:putative transposase
MRLGRRRGDPAAADLRALIVLGDQLSRDAESRRERRKSILRLAAGGETPAAAAATLLSHDRLLADTAYDADKLRQSVAERGATAVGKSNPTRTNVSAFDKAVYRLRDLIERAFSHLKDWRRVATRYDKLTRDFRATVALATIMIWWI